MIIFPCVIYKILAGDLLVIVNIRTEQTSEFVIYIHMRFYTSTGIKRYVTRSIASFPSLSFIFASKEAKAMLLPVFLYRMTNVHILIVLNLSYCKTISSMFFQAFYMSIASHSPMFYHRNNNNNNIIWFNYICEETKSMAFKGRNPVRTKIVTENKTIEPVIFFNYLGNMISYEGELDIDNKLNTFLKITGILNNDFRPQNLLGKQE